MEKKFKWLPITLLMLGIFLTIGICSHNPDKIDEPVYLEVHKSTKIDLVVDTFSIELLKQELKNQGVKFPEIVFAQAKLETGNFKADIFLVKKNLFAFRSKKAYITYMTWKESVTAYKKFQDKYYKGGDYYSFLKKIGYAEDTSYLKKVRECVQ